jgi:glycine hydroxymethyltransferase
MIMVTNKGLKKDPELAEKIDRAIFPGLQGGPHDHTTAAIAVALCETLKPEFKTYCQQIVKNSKALAKGLVENGIRLVTGGTENHMILIDLTPYGKGNGIFVQEALDLAGITVNKNTIPAEPSSPFYPSGIRLGTPAITTRGMKEGEMRLIAGWIAQIIHQVRQYQLPDDRNERAAYIGKFKQEISKNEVIGRTRSQVVELCTKFPLYPSS